MKIPTIVKEAQSALENGCCVVIGLQSTGEVQNFYTVVLLCTLLYYRPVGTDRKRKIQVFSMHFTVKGT